MNKEISEQLRFVKWLKEKGLYNELESAVAMSKMHAVWKAAQQKNKEVEPSTSNNTERVVICSDSPCDYCVFIDKSCDCDTIFSGFKGRKLSPIS
jgi:hypothetical protein